MTKNKDIPTYVIIDAEEIIRIFSGYQQWYRLYECFPLSDMIRTVLCTSAYVDHEQQAFWIELDKRLPEGSEVDLDILEMFVEYLTSYLDGMITRRLPGHVDGGEYFFHNWVNNTSFMMIRDGYSKLHHSPRTLAYV